MHRRVTMIKTTYSCTDPAYGSINRIVQPYAFKNKPSAAVTNSRRLLASCYQFIDSTCMNGLVDPRVLRLGFEPTTYRATYASIS